MSKSQYYKAVWKEKSQYHSAIRPPNCGGICYKMDKWVAPRKGFEPYLFVFKGLANARDWVHCFGSHLRIFKCEVKNPIEIKGYGYAHIGKINTFNVPYGTVLVKKVKLIKPVRKSKRK